jgi:outer membrane receptor for ferrienterochelin and colicins
MSRERFIPLCFVAALLVNPAGAKAQALSAEDLMNMPMEKLINVNVEVTSASKYAQKSSEAPSAVEVITAEDIHTFGYRTLGEALDGLRGLYAKNDRSYNYLGVRGFLRSRDYDSRILIMVDGRRMNENIYDSSNPGQEFMLDMDLVDHIEFIPGPGSSIYGANAMLGVINVITKNGADINGTQVEGGLGTYATNTERVTYGKRLNNGADVLLSASRYASDGPPNLFFPEFNQPLNNNGVAVDQDQEQSRRLFGKVKYQDFTFEGGVVDRYKQEPTATFGAIFNNPNDTTDDAWAYSEVKYDKSLTSKTDIHIDAFYHSYYYHALFPYVPVATPVLNWDAASGRWAGTEMNLVTSAFKRQKLIVGLDYQYDIRQQLYNYDVSPYVLYQNHNRMGSRVGIYAQDDYKLRDDLTLSAGFRVDENHMIPDLQFNPRLALVWDARQDTTLKLIYGSAFRAPNVSERDLGTPSPYNKEEHIRTYESDAEWRPFEGVKLTGDVFINDFTRILEDDPGGSGMVVNVGKFTAYGYDLGAEKKWESGRSVKWSFNHTILYDQTGDPEVWATDSPKNVSKLSYGEPLFDKKAMLGIENVFVDARKTLQNRDAKYYDLVNANLSSKKLLPGADVSFGVYNIFNCHPEMVGGPGTPGDTQQNVIPQNGRNVLGTIRYTF